jgi:hypothetical protein
MTSISSISNWQPVRYPTNTAARTYSPVVAGAPAPSTIVNLSPEGLAAAKRAEATAPPLGTADRFKDVGAAMLDRFRTGAAIPVDRQALPDDVDNRFTLDVVTRSGAKVALTLASAGDDMIFQVSADKALGDDERAALAGLAQGFQAAIDGMTGPDPQVRLAGLANVDPTALQSIDLHAAVKRPTLPPTTQSLDFHVDGKERKVTIDGPSGKVEVGVDVEQLHSLGTKQQQTKAIDSYVKQFDAAGARGHADAKLMTMFKDAFSDMSRTSSVDDGARPDAAPRRDWTLSKEDHAALTGLPDFHASVTQAPAAVNPLRPEEADSFTYTVSQETRTGGDARANRTVAQAQQSHLSAQYHEAATKKGKPEFDGTPATQNYDYHEVDDAAESSVDLRYKDGLLQKATLDQSVSQSERTRKYLLGKLAADHTVPAAQHLVRDLVGTLGGENTSNEGRRPSLDALADNIFLVGSGFELAQRNRVL